MNLNYPVNDSWRSAGFYWWSLIAFSLSVCSRCAALQCPPPQLDTWPLPVVLPYQQMVAGCPWGDPPAASQPPPSLPPTPQHSQSETTELLDNLMVRWWHSIQTIARLKKMCLFMSPCGCFILHCLFTVYVIITLFILYTLYPVYVPYDLAINSFDTNEGRHANH